MQVINIHPFWCELFHFSDVHFDTSFSYNREGQTCLIFFFRLSLRRVVLTPSSLSIFTDVEVHAVLKLVEVLMRVHLSFLGG